MEGFGKLLASFFHALHLPRIPSLRDLGAFHGLHGPRGCRTPLATILFPKLSPCPISQPHKSGGKKKSIFQHPAVVREGIWGQGAKPPPFVPHPGGFPAGSVPLNPLKFPRPFSPFPQHLAEADFVFTCWVQLEPLGEDASGGRPGFIEKYNGAT